MDADNLLAEDNRRLRAAGCNLAEAAMRVVNTYDGIHRLALAVADWAIAVANEGGRSTPLPKKDGEIEGLREAYNELILAVGSKYPDETRHQTALRYIREHETRITNAGSVPKSPHLSANGESSVR